MPTAVHSGAVAGSTSPGGGGLQVGLPERPRSALHRARTVNRAAGEVGLRAEQELAIAVALLEEAQPGADTADVAFGEGVGCQVQLVGNGLALWNGDPNMAGGAATAIAAACAAEAESVSVPWWGGFGIAHEALPQHFLYFLPEPQGQGSFLPTVVSRLPVQRVLRGWVRRRRRPPQSVGASLPASVRTVLRTCQFRP